MIRLKVTATPKTKNLAGTFDGLEHATFALFKKAAASRLTHVINLLRTLPGSVVYPITWTSRRQEIAFYASRGFGRGIGALRTGATAGGWRKRITDKGGGTYEAVIMNNQPGSKFVFGALTANVLKAARPQQRFHKATGWSLASPLIKLEYNGLKGDLAKDYATELKRRASQSLT